MCCTIHLLRMQPILISINTHSTVNWYEYKYAKNVKIINKSDLPAE